MASRLLRPYNIRVAHQPVAHIRKALSHPKDKLQVLERSGVVYRVNCRNCPKHYIGQTGRKLGTRLKEHSSAIRRHDQYSLISVHEDTTGHQIDLNSPQILARSRTKRAREFLESWFSGQNAINRHVYFNPAYNAIRNVGSIHHRGKGSSQHVSETPPITWDQIIDLYTIVDLYSYMHKQLNLIHLFVFGRCKTISPSFDNGAESCAEISHTNTACSSKPSDFSIYKLRTTHFRYYS